MKRLLLLVAVAGSFAAAADSANAQGYHNGYTFGLGVNNSFPVIGQSYFDRNDIPYFAKFPPVYYSHIVRRPYGVSPYAVPPGIAPIEMSIAPSEPQLIVNPFVAPSIPTSPGVPLSPSVPLSDAESSIPPRSATSPLIDAESENLSKSDSVEEVAEPKPAPKSTTKKKTQKKK